MLALVLLLLSESTGFKCPTTGRIISRGHTTYEVRTRCREPDQADQRRETRTLKHKVRRGGESIEEEQVVEVVIDEWTYDFGKHRFVRHLRFEDGRLVSVKDGERGTGEER